jgi:hypothetical protein
VSEFMDHLQKVLTSVFIYCNIHFGKCSKLIVEKVMTVVIAESNYTPSVYVWLY